MKGIGQGSVEAKNWERNRAEIIDVRSTGWRVCQCHQRKCEMRLSVRKRGNAAAV